MTPATRLAIVAVAMSLAAPALADGGVEIRKVDPDGLDRQGGAFAGVSAAFILGAFDAEGLFAASARMDPGAVFPPHAHPDTRLTIVTSGTMYLGEGERVDEAAMVAYPAGSVAVTPAGVMHFMVAGDGAATMLEIGSGPSGTTFAE